jgi:Holliday junction DNA helicase RuvA
MIGSLRGKLVMKQAPHLVVEVGGVGYEIEAPMTTFYKLPVTGEDIQLYTHLVVREDAHLLFGFASEQERRLFRTLIKVNGVGAKLALTILSGIETDEFILCIQSGNTDRLVRLPGIGKKTAERLVVEMRDRLKDWHIELPGRPAGPVTGRTSASAVDDAVSALVSLGYKPQEASRLVLAIATNEMNSETLIREALKASVR